MICTGLHVGYRHTDRKLPCALQMWNPTPSSTSVVTR